MNLYRAFAFVVVCVAMTKSSIPAATVVFSDRTSWQSASSAASVGGIQTEDFNAYGDFRGQLNTAVTLGSFSLTPLSPNQRVVLSDNPGQYLHNGTRYALTSGQLRFEFPDPIASFALDHKATTGSGLNSIEIFDRDENLISSYSFIPSQPVAFTGFLLDAGELAKSVAFSPAFGPTDSWSADNVSFAVPEPAAHFLLPIAVAIFTTGRRQRK